METELESFLMYIENSGWLAPLLFIVLHVVRQILFIPVVAVCILGGILFGTFYGTIFSVIGLTLVSLVFYGLVQRVPWLKKKISMWKTRWMKDKEELNLTQILILRTMPFIHFHLMNAYLLEMSKNVREFTKLSLIASVPPAVMYTAFGHVIRELPWYVSIGLVLILVIIFLLSRNKSLQYKVRTWLPGRASS
ncbi:TVP38/TMEM64 family protein [Salsuginibacillus kocurii]|uniref:TVP38/TMEM64 family protein n=1 Tax=Salsuginibacillus kocurii TaxID=427078 RepID=UPI0003794829|nr:VTT domain-containing protein [Salsuginibacillus kocurii]